MDLSPSEVSLEPYVITPHSTHNLDGVRVKEDSGACLAKRELNAIHLKQYFAFGCDGQPFPIGRMQDITFPCLCMIGFREEEASLLC